MPKIKTTDKKKADEKALPPVETEPKVPNATTSKAIRDARLGRLTHYDSVEELFKKLGS
jgi:antitoxin component of RelBE/YafQ-DinJ toxin-antitoxin module